MRKLIVSEFLTLDGVMEDPGGAEGFVHGGWSFKFPDPAGMKFKLDEILACDAMLLGRVTYQAFAAAWPSRTDEAGFADKMNGMAKYVVSATLGELEWANSQRISGDVAAEVARLKEQPGGDILIAGSATLVQGLMPHGLIDEYRLMVHPIVLGSGRRLFGGGDDTTVLRLVDAQPLASGSVILTYEPARH